MGRSGEKHPDLAGRVAAHLRLHGTASSHVLAERFLKLAAPSEEAATRILRAVLEPHGLVYEEGSGWLAGRPAPGSERPRLVAVGLGEAEDPVLVEVRGAGIGEPLPPAAVSLEGATAILLEPRRDAIRLTGFLGRERLAPPAGFSSLRAAVRGGPRIPRRAGLGDICAALGIRWNDGDAAGRAVAMARCLARASEWRENPAGEDERRDLPGMLTTELLDSLPEAPGVYRFIDAEGRLLYVGKAVNLRRRVRSYFGGRRATGHGARFLSRVHRLEHEALGSELEALLKEARLIARRKPSANVQAAVHERGRAYGAARREALLLGSASSRIVTVVFLRHGRYAGHVPIGPRGGGLEKARRMLRRVMRVMEEGDSPRGARRDPDTEILASWLARHGDSVSRIELDSFARVEDAVEALRHAMESVLAETGPQVFRGP